MGLWKVEEDSFCTSGTENAGNIESELVRRCSHAASRGVARRSRTADDEAVWKPHVMVFNDNADDKCDAEKNEFVRRKQKKNQSKTPLELLKEATLTKTLVSLC